MTEQLKNLFRDEAERLDVSPPPIQRILTDGRDQRRTVRRTRNLVAVAASVVLIAGGAFGVSQLLNDDGRASSPGPSGDPSTPPVLAGPLDVSGEGVGTQPFGADADEVLSAVAAQFGQPDLTVGPQHYQRGEGGDWLEDADDPISLSWNSPILSVSCWSELCLIFGGAEEDSLQLKGWELAETRRWTSEVEADPAEIDVRLADSGIRLGDSWAQLHAAYPGTRPGGGEGASLVVNETPWPAIFDGVGGWRLSGSWDYTQPNRAPDDAEVTRLSGGEGPEPGCC